MLFTLLIASCSPSSSQAVPTYDPFAPVGATNVIPAMQDGVTANSTPGPRGAAPTRAPALL
ncbi:MAG: hypothetical protein MZV64_24065 [Ignavibacteriales bacterium]|nr:hypothetical protein [Ignavibacteriales bacterium]